MPADTASGVLAPFACAVRSPQSAIAFHDTAMNCLAKTSYIILTSCLLLAESSHAQQARRALTFDDFAAVRLVSDPQISPDGRSLLYALRTADVEANRRVTHTMLTAVATPGNARRFPNDTTRATEARWSPDGSRIAYVAGGQLWVADARGGDARRITNLAGGAGGAVWAPTGTHIAFVSTVTPDCSDDACNRAREKAREESKVKAYTADRLLYRHWNAWDSGTRSHLFVINVDGTGLRDLTAGARYDVPVPPFGGSEQYAWSPDGRELAYTAKEPTRDEAWSTDVNVYLVSIGGGAPRVITAANKGADQNPVYAPNARFLVYASQERAGFESDRWRLMFHDRARGTSREALVGWDRSPDSYFFSSDGRSLFVLAQDGGREKLFRFRMDVVGAPTPQPLVAEHNNTQFTLSRDGGTIAWVRDAAHRPHEVFIGTVGDRGLTNTRQLTRHNDELLSRLQLNPVEEMWSRGALGDSVHSFVLRPPQWEAGKKFPVILLIHGGPQGAWLDTWHSRWNYQMMAAPGFGLVIVNPRGSTGYGQAFLDSVTKNWGDEVYRDLMQALDAALARNTWMDSTRLGATGGSFGGYMTNWIAGHTNRFDALVSHAGVFNLEAMYGATEELWFTDWEFGGPWWDSTAMATQYRRYSPHLFAKNFETPTLVIHGELDYRVPYTEGLSLFTALQRRGVPSRLLVFPDEGHWILKPQNQRLWWSEVQGWFGRYLRGGAVP
jgi:dipeptidyl aminopeptidase/acylaminoacyl peptidase